LYDTVGVSWVISTDNHGLLRHSDAF
jgi:hypothetical protein